MAPVVLERIHQFTVLIKYIFQYHTETHFAILNTEMTICYKLR